VRYYPVIQLIIVALFIIITKNYNKEVATKTPEPGMAGLAKETAHQLGTPVPAWKDG